MGIGLITHIADSRFRGNDNAFLSNRGDATESYSL